MLKILEKIWIGIGAVSLAIAIYSFFITKDSNQSVYFLVLAVISGLMFYARNRRRKSIEKQMAESNQQKN
ncbi:MAG: hypothetical protein J0M08_05235 [Bacteroidetes bacterium]|nr:hypothetical protein [Bacteroidota bacterium]